MNETNSDTGYRILKGYSAINKFTISLFSEPFYFHLRTLPKQHRRHLEDI